MDIRLVFFFQHGLGLFFLIFLKAPQQAFNPVAVFKGRVVKKFHLRHIP